MSYAPFEKAGSLRIGAVDFVSSDEIRVTLDSEAPESVALNSGYPRPFPRVNGYLIVQVDEAFLVGQVQSLTVERAPFPRHSKIRDSGFIDLPYPHRQLKLNPLGILKNESDEGYVFQRGSESLPSVGAAVLLPTRKQLYAIVESDEYRRVKIGTSLLAGDAQVYVDPNRLFGRHLAVLGNTGSGKSCSVAGLIRWSLEAAKQESKGKQPNARFIILDPNGEYSRAFNEKEGIKARVFKLNLNNNEESNSKTVNEQSLKVPLWFWNSEEWSAFAQASAKTQRPALLHALGLVRDAQTEFEPEPAQIVRIFLGTLLSGIKVEFNQGNPWKGKFPANKNFFFLLEDSKKSLEEFDKEPFSDDQQNKLEELIDMINKLCDPYRAIQYPNYHITPVNVGNLISMLSDTYQLFGGSDSDMGSVGVDAPRPFNANDLIKVIEYLSKTLYSAEYIETLVLRIKALISDPRIKSVIGEGSDEKNGGDLADWLKRYIGSNNAEDGCVSIIDLSLVPTEIIHIVTAVIARMIFEALQRYMKLNKTTLPTVLVMEEAHTFVKYRREDIENQDAASVCCKVFERIAREGRKFGLGLVISSQRPSEISPTVLSQCNTFLLHRISNDRDQERVKGLVPDNLKGLLSELPLLPSQRAILLGWASELPVLVRMRDLPESQRPQSDDPEIWEVWTHDKKREVDWVEIASEWQDRASKNQTSQDNNPNAQQEGEGQKGDTGDGDATDHIQNEPNPQDDDDDDEESEQNYTHPHF